MNSYSTSPLESAPDSSASLEMDDYCQIKLQKDNGKSINFAFLPSYTVKEIDWGVRSALNIPKSATYSISFKDNGEDVHMAPNGGMLKECVVLKKIVKLDVNVRPTTPQLQPQPQSCNLSIERWRDYLVTCFFASVSTSSSANKGDDAQRWPWPALLERFDRRNNRLTTHSGQPDWIRVESRRFFSSVDCSSGDTLKHRSRVPLKEWDWCGKTNRVEQDENYSRIFQTRRVLSFISTGWRNASLLFRQSNGSKYCW